MATSLLYCPACGAANALNDSACFACQQLLPLSSGEYNQAHLLHNRYQMLGQLGIGGFGAVYKALDIQAQNRDMAIKQINLRGLSPQEMIEATDGFNREVQMLSTLSHAHLPRIYDHFTDPNHWYIVMDFIAGETLEHYLRDIASTNENAIRTLMVDEVLDIGLQLCNVLVYLHEQQPSIIFRDLKPSNIMRTPQGRLYLIDFGIARYFKPGQARDTIPLGSPGYAAPEQYGRAQTTPRADIYSLGALLHHLLSRHDPSETPFTFAPLGFASSSEMGALETLIARMVEQDSEQRPLDIGEIESSLLRIRNQLASEPRLWRPAPPHQKVPPPVLAQGAYQTPQARQQLAARKKSRRKFLLGGLAVASTLALSGSIGGFANWRHWHPANLALQSDFPRQLTQSDSDVSTIAWSPDAQSVAFGLSDGSVAGYLPFTTAAGFSITPSFILQANSQEQLIKVLAWSPDNRLLAVISQFGALQLWNLDLKKNQTLSIGKKNIVAAAWSPDNKTLAIIDGQGIAYLYNTQNGTTVQLGSTGYTFSGTLAWSPNGKYLVTELISNTSPDEGAYETSVTLQIWEISADINATQSFAAIPLNDLTTTTTLIWSPDGQNIALLSIDGTVSAWDIKNNCSQVFSQQINTQSNQLAWSPDNRFLATIDGDNNLLLLDISSGNTLVSTAIDDPLGRGCVFPGQALVWLPDSQHIAVANNNMECWLWSLPTF